MSLTELKVAYVGKVIALEPIAEADRLESATVVCGEGGKWQGVVGKSQFVLGDLCEIYLQDALLPKDDTRFAFMEKNKFRVKICRFRGALSEALIMPLTIDSTSIEVGTNIAAMMNVTKYEKPLSPMLTGLAKGNFPSFIPKTDEPNVQRSGRMLEALTGQPFIATKKMDGSSATYYKHDGVFGVCSRNLELKDEGENAFWAMARKYNLAGMPDGFAIQAELCGPKIQGNPAGLPDIELFAFNVWSTNERRYLSYTDAFNFVTSHTSMPFVPSVDYGQSFDPEKFRTEEFWDTQRYQNGKQIEGIVVRPLIETFVRGERLSFKMINPGYKESE